MSQNIYDDPNFFAGYSGLPRSIGGLDAAPEWPSLKALLPPMPNLRVLDLGCGFGWFSRWAREQGAACVLGLDISENMLSRAQDNTSDTGITYQRADLEQLVLPVAAFDVTYSSLVLHYIRNLGRLFATLHDAIVPGGHLVFSIEHPIFMAPSSPGWVADTAGRTVWPIDGYLIEGPRTTDWFAPGVIKHHRTLGSTLNLLIAHGFAIAHVEEWGPADAQIAAHPEWAVERNRPMFLLVAARRSG